MKLHKESHVDHGLTGEQLAHVRRVNTVTVIAGPHDGNTCVLYTVFGGPLAPKEVNDPTLTDDKRAESVAFWSEHALSR